MSYNVFWLFLCFYLDTTNNCYTQMGDMTAPESEAKTSGSAPGGCLQ